MATLPTAHVDLTQYPRFSTHPELRAVMLVEIMTMSLNTGNMRVRLFDKETKQCVYKNLDISMSYIVPGTLDLAGTILDELRKNAVKVWQVGDKVRLAVDLEEDDAGAPEIGSTGTITYIDKDAHDLEVCVEWDNFTTGHNGMPMFSVSPWRSENRDSKAHWWVSGTHLVIG